MKTLPRVPSNTRRKALKIRDTKLLSDRNTAKFARTQESLGEQEASRANLNASETTCEVSHAERLAEFQTIVKASKIQKEDQTDAVLDSEQRTSFADSKNTSTSSAFFR